MKTALIVPVLLASTLAAGVAGAAPQPLEVIGSSAPQQSPVDRVIVVNDATRYVNVTGGSTVRFVVGDRSFTWNFQTGTQEVIPFDLQRIAPEGTLNHKVTTYVSTNPLYLNN